MKKTEPNKRFHIDFCTKYSLKRFRFSFSPLNKSATVSPINKNHSLVSSLRFSWRAPRVTEDNRENILKAKISGLLRYMQRVRKEIVGMDRGRDEDRNFETMGKQLDAIVDGN